jgi:hypothetical protein
MISNFEKSSFSCGWSSAGFIVLELPDRDEMVKVICEASLPFRDELVIDPGRWNDDVGKSPSGRQRIRIAKTFLKGHKLVYTAS